ncbi:flagellar biosynthesis protein FlhB [Azohydromonas sediminis]|uniref:flagellar biosynthesis protein FlhB n=1 Tax=Azohydromonas sediminis TaxID=2259674 RepID=UPI000E656C9F|nr:flagellar biosynthesis protein FlhB [Azohydromonas sediminis]
MADESSQNKTLPATPRKIRKAREEGQVARSRDLGHFAVVAGALGALLLAGPLLAAMLRELVADGLRVDPALVADPRRMAERLAGFVWQGGAVVIALGALVIALAVAAATLVGGWNFTAKPLVPKLGKINPIAGFGRMFSKQQLTDTLKASVLAVVLGTIGALYLHGKLGEIQQVIALPLPAALAEASGLLFGGLALLALALAGFALVDVPLQRHLLAQRLKMSHQEVKQELKETEGSPEVKGRIRTRMREMSRTRMLAAVAGADLVVMNPTHYAVALKYDERAMAAPRVVAKGTDLLALKIRDLAHEARVPVLQAPPLARALYAHTEVDHEVPAALFAAVAQVLAHVYRLRDALGRGRVGDIAEGDLPPLPVPPELDPHRRRGAAGADA